MTLIPRGTKQFESLHIWSNMKPHLPWYYDVATNRKPAKYLISRRVGTSMEIEKASEDDLWNEHNNLMKTFLERWEGVKDGKLRLENIEKAKTSLLDVNVALVKHMLAHCNFCRWNCRVDRSRGIKYGTCKLESTSRVSSYFHHPGEELVFRGTSGSGTIFFTSCNLRCNYCQNGDISTDKDNGIPITPQMLALMAWQLRMEGCHNVNWVGGEPTIHLHSIIEAISLLDSFKPDRNTMKYIESAKSDYFENWHMRAENAFHANEFNAPQLWNSNFFMSEETLRLLRPLIDVWLPDFKFGSGKCAMDVSRTPWYWETVTKNLKTVYDWHEDMVIRHLIMPNHVECCTKPVLDWIAKHMPEIPVNIMDQYHPDNLCDPHSPKYRESYKEMARTPTNKEIIESYTYAKVLGLNFEPLSYEKSVHGLEV